MTFAAVCAEKLFDVVYMIMKTAKELVPREDIRSCGQLCLPSLCPTLLAGPKCGSSSLTAEQLLAKIPVKS